MLTRRLAQILHAYIKVREKYNEYYKTKYLHVKIVVQWLRYMYKVPTLVIESDLNFNYITFNSTLGKKHLKWNKYVFYLRTLGACKTFYIRYVTLRFPVFKNVNMYIIVIGLQHFLMWRLSLACRKNVLKYSI